MPLKIPFSEAFKSDDISVVGLMIIYLKDGASWRHCDNYMKSA
jgi:hypothetical protein